MKNALLILVVVMAISYGMKATKQISMKVQSLQAQHIAVIDKTLAQIE